MLGLGQAVEEQFPRRAMDAPVGELALPGHLTASFLLRLQLGQVLVEAVIAVLPHLPVTAYPLGSRIEPPGW